ncbi:hypothetical protein RN001_003932 [Aquatica leii]|uniref:SANT domain-containing protein n=1 Tax=Aquatica leii TaxID=1421715 RepID=A0AAN7PRN6_9COLE|nr:hypothetical protein RN001_003932 [Aquatica leii]
MTEAVSVPKAVLDENNVPIEELLGSVTTYNNVDGSDSKSQQLRTSARVFKKMKLDSAVSIPTATDQKKEAAKEETKPEANKKLRPTWSQEDKNLFFEALNEFGKDFESIHSYIATKLKKKGLPDSVMKTKDQVRHFYYRTWHKISKHLKFSDDIKKLAQELYGLINYGELRKKIGSVSEKTCMKLNELIYRGSVSIRFKGKTIRVKTPMCRALRKLNQLDENHDDLKLPTRVNVELIAKDMNSWLRVQGMSQNPRVKASLPLQKRLSTLIRFLTCKWKSTDAIAYENHITSSNDFTSDCVPEKKMIDFNKLILDPYLRITPRPKTHIELPTINISEYLTSQSICLNAFEERIGVKTPGEQLWVVKGATKKGGTKRARNESTSEKSSPTNKTGPTSSQMDNNENCIKEIPSFDEVMDEAINTILSLQQETPIIAETKESEDVKDETTKETKDTEKKEDYIKNVLQGWTLQTCGTLSVGELYLMFGSNSKLVLEYSWDNPDEVVPKKENCDSIEVNKNEQVEASLANDIGVVQGTLQRLLSIAKLQYRKNIVKCPCGHVCSGNKPSANKTKLPVAKAKLAEKVNIELQDKSGLNENVNQVEQGALTNSVVPIIIQSPATIFARPVSPNIDALRAQLDSIQRLQPRYCNRRGRRPRSKQVVVERRLPLLPNKTGSGRQIVQMNIIAHDSLSSVPRMIAPKIINVDKTEHNITNIINTQTNETPLQTFGTNVVNVDNDINVTVPTESIAITDNAITPSRVGSPTSISNLLDLAIGTQSEDILNQPVLQNKEDTGIPSFVGLLSSNGTPPTSPSRILKENENQWLNSEVADFSLSSFLGHLESPSKAATQSGLPADDNHLSQDVDAQLQSLFMESSVDYMAKFADLAAQVVSDVKK